MSVHARSRKEKRGRRQTTKKTRLGLSALTLDVAVDDTLLVQKLQPSQDLCEIYHTESLGECAVLLHDCSQRAALHQLENDVQFLRGLDHVHVLHDVRVPQLFQKENLRLNRDESERERGDWQQGGKVKWCIASR